MATEIRTGDRFDENAVAGEEILVLDKDSSQDVRKVVDIVKKKK